MKLYLLKSLPAIITLFLISPESAKAQDETVKKLKSDAEVSIKKDADTAKVSWKKGGIYNLNLAQGSSSNWAAGGDKFSLAVTSLLNLFSYYKNEKYSWDNTLDVNFGYVRTSSLGGRKNDDRLDFLSKYGRPISDKWNFATLFNFRTQFFKGYNYNDANEKIFTSAFLSPAYVLASVGLDYKPSTNFSVFISPATARFIIVKDDSLAAKGLYGVDKGKNLATELGAFVSAAYFREFNTAVSFKSRLDLFSNYRREPKNIDVFMTNILSVKLTRLFSLSWNLDLIYDDDVKLFGPANDSPGLQLKSLVGLGLMVKF
jgi:hypothetical protein